MPFTRVSVRSVAARKVEQLAFDFGEAKATKGKGGARCRHDVHLFTDARFTATENQQALRSLKKLCLAERSLFSEAEVEVGLKKFWKVARDRVTSQKVTVDLNSPRLLRS